MRLDVEYRMFFDLTLRNYQVAHKCEDCPGVSKLEKECFIEAVEKLVV